MSCHRERRDCLPPARLHRLSFWAVAQLRKPRWKRCDERDTAGALQCSARARRHLTIGQICQRTSSPVPQAGNGFRCGIPRSIGKNDVDLRLGVRATAIDTNATLVRTADGDSLSYGALLIATGAEPVRLDIPGAGLSHVHYLRSLADSRSIVQAAEHAKNAVVIGASFIGLEVAASLRARNVHVDVVAPDRIPMERILGREIGTVIRRLHEEHGVQFHLPSKVRSLSDHQVVLELNEMLDADLVVVGIGVRPSLGLAEQAGIALDRSITVDKYLRTSVPGIFAAGDVARWPDPHTEQKVRVEHWVVAERQGRTAARNMTGQNEPFDAVPFFWSAHYDTQVLYVGHAETWDTLQIDGSVEARDCRVAFRSAGRTLAVATIGRDLDSLRAELELEAARPAQ